MVGFVCGVVGYWRIKLGVVGRLSTGRFYIVVVVVVWGKGMWGWGVGWYSALLFSDRK